MPIVITGFTIAVPQAKPGLPTSLDTLGIPDTRTPRTLENLGHAGSLSIRGRGGSAPATVTA